MTGHPSAIYLEITHYVPLFLLSMVISICINVALPSTPDLRTWKSHFVLSIVAISMFLVTTPVSYTRIMAIFYSYSFGFSINMLSQWPFDRVGPHMCLP